MTNELFGRTLVSANAIFSLWREGVSVRSNLTVTVKQVLHIMKDKTFIQYYGIRCAALVLIKLSTETKNTALSRRRY